MNDIPATKTEKEPLINVLPQRIDRAMRFRDRTQEETASACGMTLSRIKGLMGRDGKSKAPARPKTAELLRLKEFLEISLDYLCDPNISPDDFQGNVRLDPVAELIAERMNESYALTKLLEFASSMDEQQLKFLVETAELQKFKARHDQLTLVAE